MTLVVAAQGEDFVILGADSRGTMTDAAKNRMEVNIMNKLHVITDRVGILVYGSGGNALYLIEKFKKTIQNSNDNVSKVVEDFSEFCRREFKKLKDVPTVNLPFFGFVITGLDIARRTITPHCYFADSYNGFLIGEDQTGYEINGKPIIAEYLFTKHYHEHMSVDDLCELVVRAINDTKSIDGDVGGKIHLAIIDKDGFRNYSDDDVEDIINSLNQS